MGTVRTLWLSLSSVVAAGSLILGGADCLAADETQVNTYTLNGQTDPSVAMDADGDSVVTWESYGQSGGAFARSDVYAQRFDSNGDPSGVEFAVYAASYDQRNPATAMDGDGNFVIVFETDISGMSSFQIWGWRYAANGAFLGSQFITNDSISKQFPSIAMASGSGNFVVAWDSPDASSYGIYARRYNDQGIPYAAIFPSTPKLRASRRSLPSAWTITAISSWPGKVMGARMVTELEYLARCIPLAELTQVVSFK